jgi:hypothetical protein
VRPYTFILLLSVALFSCSDTLSKKEIKLFTEKGDLIANQTAEELSDKLMSKMKEGGIPLALEYCNTAALPLTQQMSDKHGVLIKRTSLKTRNPLNKPSEPEIIILKEFQVNIDQGISLEPKVELDQNGIPNYYAPILIEKKCLICHGTLDKELSRPTDSIIKSYYPSDMATGFTEGDLRGMWSITFPKSES